jgi:hypothetical protein
MGCGQNKIVNPIALAVQQPHTKVIRDVSVELLGGLQKPQRLGEEATMTEGGVTYFDDEVYMKQSSSRIEAMTVFYSQYINGVEVSYYIGTTLKTLCHAHTSGKKTRIDFLLNERIDSISCTFGDSGVHSFKLMTTDSRKIEVCGSQGLGSQAKAISRTTDKDILGFFGAYNSHLVSLSVYLVLTEDATQDRH